MQLQVKVEELRKKKIFVATPMYGGMAHGMFVKSCLDLQAVGATYGVEVRFSFIFNESLITRARNYLVDEFLRAEQFTHMLFIDADIHFDPRDVIALLALDKDIIGGPYPKKSIKWAAVKEAIVKNPDIDAGELEKVSGDFVFNPAPGTEKFSVVEPIEVLEIGTGFMMIKREVFAQFRDAYPELRYKPDHVGQANFDGSRYIHAYFDTVIDHGKSDRYLSEDYMFCQWWRKIGGKIWLCPWMKTHHIGTYAFTGDMPAVANYVGSL
jgi:hypothetical protein